jgi:hypothetical protein
MFRMTSVGSKLGCSAVINRSRPQFKAGIRLVQMLLVQEPRPLVPGSHLKFPSCTRTPAPIAAAIHPFVPIHSRQSWCLSSHSQILPIASFRCSRLAMSCSALAAYLIPCSRSYMVLAFIVDLRMQRALHAFSAAHFRRIALWCLHDFMHPCAMSF